MRKKIGILGSTGSIGKTLLSLIDKKNTEIIFLSANSNYKKILKQAKIYNVKNIIISDKSSFIKANNFNTNKNIKIFNSEYNFKKIIKDKLDYVMSSIIGIAGLKPTFEIIKFTKKIAIANKETLVCAWPLIKKELVKYGTEFIPVDSEHFSIWREIKDHDPTEIDKVFLTASGGPLLKYKNHNSKKIKISSILNHPTWKMGKKISVDSATMMNKCFEVIEAKNIFNLNYRQIKILIHPDSYVHAVVVYKNGLSKIILHETTMKVPIFNSIYGNDRPYSHNTKINIKKLNDLKLEKVDEKQFPIIKCLKLMPHYHSLFETVMIVVNDYYVNEFLSKKINFYEISKFILKFLKKKNTKKYKKIVVRSINDISKLTNFINTELKTFN